MAAPVINTPAHHVGRPCSAQDLIAVVESNDAAAFQAAIGAVENVDPAESVSAVKLTRTL